VDGNNEKAIEILRKTQGQKNRVPNALTVKQPRVILAKTMYTQ